MQIWAAAPKLTCCLIGQRRRACISGCRLLTSLPLHRRAAVRPACSSAATTQQMLWPMASSRAARHRCTHPQAPRRMRTGCCALRQALLSMYLSQNTASLACACALPHVRSRMCLSSDLLMRIAAQAATTGPVRHQGGCQQAVARSGRPCCFAQLPVWTPFCLQPPPSEASQPRWAAAAACKPLRAASRHTCCMQDAAGALAIYDDLISAAEAPQYALCANRAAAHLALGRWQAAVEDCDAAARLLLGALLCLKQSKKRDSQLLGD